MPLTDAQEMRYARHLILDEVGEASHELTRIGLSHFREGLRLLGMAVAESPEVQARQRTRSGT